MKYQWIAMALVFCAAGAFFPAGAGAQYLLGEEPVTAEVSGAAGFPGHARARVLAETEDYRFVFTAQRERGRPGKDFTAAGCETPWLVLGPVTAGGLFREVFSPLSYAAGSPVFAETTRLLLNTRTEKSVREGFWLSVPGDYLAAGAYSDGDGITHASAAFNFFRGKRGPLFSGLFMASEPESRLSSDEWFPEKPLFSGGRLYHSGLRAQIPFDKLTGGISRVGASGAFSFGERTAPGGYYHLFAAHTDKKIDIRLLQGAAQKEYATPAGKPVSYSVNSAASLKLFPRGPVIPYASAARTTYQVYRPMAEARPERLRVSGGTEYRTKRLSVRLEGSRKIEKDERGRRERAESLRASCIYKTGRGSVFAEYASGWENAVMRSRRLSLRLAYTPKGWEFSGRVKGEWLPALALSGKLSAAIDRPGFSLGLSAELVKPVSPRLSGIRAAREKPEDYGIIELFFRYKTKF